MCLELRKRLNEFGNYKIFVTVQHKDFRARTEFRSIV